LGVGRKRRGRRAGKTGGGALTSLRGGFKSVARGVTGTKSSGPPSRGGRFTSNLITVLLVLVVVGLLMRRLGVLHHR
jgi:hypothetical protein